MHVLELVSINSSGAIHRTFPASRRELVLEVLNSGSSSIDLLSPKSMSTGMPVSSMSTLSCRHRDQQRRVALLTMTHRFYVTMNDYRISRV